MTSGEGVVQAAPDRAFITVVTESRAANPREAQARNTQLMKPVQDKLRGLGIPADAIRTLSYDLHQEFDFPNGRRVAKGFVAINSVEVRVDAIDRLGELLDVVVTAGATSINDIRFDLKDRAKLERDAVRLAVADARARAESAGAGAGATLDRIVRIEEHGVIAPPMPMARMAMQERAQAADVPVSAGQIELRARVSLTMSLR